MARGSERTQDGSGGSGSAVEMLGQSGGIENTGRYIIRKKFLVSKEDDLKKVPTPPPSFRARSISWQAIGAGNFEQTVEYEYFVAAGASEVVETLGGVVGRFELDTQDELLPIEKHPNIKKLIEKYGGKEDDNGRVTFPTKYSPAAGSGLEGGGNSTGTKTNPMAGIRYFTRPSATFRHIQQMDSIPANIWNEVGKKVDQLPAGFPNPPAFVNEEGENIKYHWIVLSPQIYRRGNAYEVVRSYKLSDPGVPEELHKTSTPQTGGGGGGAGGTPV